MFLIQDDPLFHKPLDAWMVRRIWKVNAPPVDGDWSTAGLSHPLRAAADAHPSDFLFGTVAVGAGARAVALAFL